MMAALLTSLGISIHAPREGGDYAKPRTTSPTCDFNPRPPRGGRLSLTNSLSYVKIFQSTPPARGATRRNRDIHGNMTISIHAPREGGD